MPLTRRLFVLLAVVVLAAAGPALAPALAEEPPAGEVTKLGGTVRAVSSEGVARTLEEGSRVFATDRVETGRRSQVKIRFEDGTRFELGEDAALRVDRFSMKPDEEEFGASVLKGVFRFLTGVIAKRRRASMRVTTPVANIGIRGTQVGGEASATSARIILLEPEDADEPTAIEVSNEFGSVVIDEPGFGTEVPDEFSPPSPPRRMRLRAIQNLMRSLQSIQRVRPPRIP